MQSEFTIRPVRLTDAEAITGIYNPFITQTTISFETQPLTAEEMRQRIAEISSSYPYFVCEKSGQVCGYCYVHAWKERKAYAHTLEVTIYLAPSAQGHGVGVEMLRQLIDASRQCGAKVLIACITGGNDRSIRLHRSLGFEQVSCFKNVGYKFGKLLDVVDLELIL